MVTPNSMQFVTREAARIDGFMSAAGDALFQTGFVDPIVAAAYGKRIQAAAAAAAVAASIVDVGWHQRTATDIGALWDGNQVRLQSLGYLPPTMPSPSPSPSLSPSTSPSPSPNPNPNPKPGTCRSTWRRSLRRASTMARRGGSARGGCLCSRQWRWGYSRTHTPQS